MYCFTMWPLSKIILLGLPLFVWLSIIPFQSLYSPQNGILPTPTYDPLAEPPLPPNPTEYELGRNLYWHWCMTCHGDHGQGLTDAFRAVWDSDHQNCWARGCHTGHTSDLGFPIPTVVPALVDQNHLARFSSIQSLADFLKATHPPQSPGILKDKEYHVIALFVFAMNGRAAISLSATAAPVPSAVAVAVSSSGSSDEFAFVPIAVLIGLIAFILIFAKGVRHPE